MLTYRSTYSKRKYHTVKVHQLKPNDTGFNEDCYMTWWLNTIQNYSLSNTGYPASKHTIHVIISLLCLPQLETWGARWWSWTARLCHSQTKASQTSTHTIPVYVLSSQAVIAAKANFVPNSFSTQYPTTWKSAGTVSPYHTCPVAFGSLSALEHLQGCITSGIGRCLSGVWSGSTLRKTSVQLSRPPDATHSA